MTAAPRRLLSAALALLAGSLGLTGCGPATPATPSTPDVILVSIDTLRADHLGCYGYASPTTPHIDAFRRDAVLFRQAIAAASVTLTAHASMMTSLLPQQHGAEHPQHSLAPRLLTLATLFRQHGYRALSWNDGGEIDAASGIANGFDLYRSAPPTDRYHFAGDVEPALAWLDGHPRAPLFLFLHTYEVHHPYTPDARYLAMMEPPYHGKLPAAETPMSVLLAVRQLRLALDATDVRHVVATYDGEIRDMDDSFGRLIEWLKAHDRYDGALIAFTADHGEEFGEHGGMGWHGDTLYDEQVHVPLIVKFPHGRYAGETVAAQVRQIDIAPTLVAAMGWPQPRQFRGTDLAPLAAGREAPTPRFAVGKLDAMQGAAIRMPPWKLFNDRLYDLAHDPGELHDVAATHRDIATALAARLRQLVAEVPAATGPPPVLSPALRANLRALGYL